MYSKKRGTKKNFLNLSNINNKIHYQVIKPLIPQKEIEIMEEQSTMNMGKKEKIYLNEDIGNKNTHKTLRKKIFIKADSHKPNSQKAKLSNYIYKTERPIYKNIHSNSKLTTDFIRYNTNSRYNIKNPV
jgi:hypothetical protein